MLILGATKNSEDLKNRIKEFLKSENLDVIEVNQEDENFVRLSKNVVDLLKKDPENLAIIIDEYGVGSFIAATKIKGVIAANVSDERSAYMTRSHNNSKVITLGSKIVGEKLAINIVKSFVEGKYDAGRHQIRVDMLNKMC